MNNYIYSRISKEWISDDSDKHIEKLGCTKNIEYRKWMGATERLHQTNYKWYIHITELGKFRSLVSAEQTIFDNSFFKKRRVDNGAGTEFFEISNIETTLKKAREILVQYDVKFKVVEGDPFPVKPKYIPVEKKLPTDEPLPQLTNPKTNRIQPRPYQEKCVNIMLTVLKGIIVAATGIGKTIIMCMYMKKVGGKYLIVVPSEKLVSQTVQTCQKFLGHLFTVHRYNEDMNDWLPEQENVVIIGLYQSSHKLRKLKGINCIIFDECHSTVVLNPPRDSEGKETLLSRYQKLLKYKCDYKFFFTATEKNIQADSKVISMDNEDVYGPVIFRYDLSQAIKDGWLCDYLFHLVATKDRITSCVKYVKSGYKTVIFCGKQETVEKVHKKLKKKLPESIGVFKLGENDDVENNTKHFSDYEGQAVIIACRKITMGYDEPQIDTVIHYNLTTSSIMVHQRNGRVFRLHSDKVMATLVFLCDISGDEKKRKKKIKKLHHPIAHLKEMDTRFEKRIEKERLKSKEEFRTIDVIVDDFDFVESKEVYDRCWRMIDNKKITYKKAKEIIKLSKPRPQSWKDYLELCDRDSRLYRNPEDVYRGKFEGHVEYLGLNRRDYVSLQKYKEAFSKYNIDILELSKICIELEKKYMFPPSDLVIDMYRLNRLDDIISQKNSIKITDIEFNRMFT
tara:strand:+ start:1682 stop:3715 length:2034 start_codon:yes stop_codon:yes gene_type:complete